MTSSSTSPDPSNEGERPPNPPGDDPDGGAQWTAPSGGQRPDGSPPPAPEPAHDWSRPGGPHSQPTGVQPGPLPPNGLAMVSMVLGFLGLWLSLFGGFFTLVSVAALVTGIVALQMAKTGRAGGRGAAIAGIVMGTVGMATVILFFVLFMLGA